ARARPRAVQATPPASSAAPTAIRISMMVSPRADPQRRGNESRPPRIRSPDAQMCDPKKHEPSSSARLRETQSLDGCRRGRLDSAGRLRPCSEETPPALQPDWSIAFHKETQNRSND